MNGKEEAIKKPVFHKPLVQSKKNGQFMTIKPLAKNNTAEKSVHERTMKPVKSKEIETINFM